jgi:hypothetical protein
MKNMRNKFIILLVLASFMALSSNAIAQEQKNDLVEKLRWIASANPNLDARQAIKRKDFRLRAIYGYSLIVPGIEQTNYDEYQKKFGFNPIEGTSDSLVSAEHARLNQLAYKYAQKYNEVILNYYKS